MGVEDEVIKHCLPRLFKEEAGRGGYLDLVGAKCLIYRLSRKEISRREIYETHLLTSSRSIAIEDEEYGISLVDFQVIFEELSKKHFITESTIVNNLYGSLDENRVGFTDEPKLAKCLIRAGCPHLAMSRANEYFSRVDELHIGKCSITQVHTVLRNGAK